MYRCASAVFRSNFLPFLFMCWAQNLFDLVQFNEKEQSGTLALISSANNEI